MLTWLRRALWDRVPRDHRATPAALRHRQLVTAGFVVLGGIVLGLSLRIDPGSPWFYPATLGLAAVWAVGAFASGPLHLGRLGTGTAATPGSAGRRQSQAAPSVRPAAPASPSQSAVVKCRGQ